MLNALADVELWNRLRWLSLQPCLSNGLAMWKGPRMADDPDVLELRVTNAAEGTNSLMLRVSPGLVKEMQAGLDAAGLEHSQALEHSDGPQLALEIVTVLGASAANLHGLAAVIRAVTRRSDGKKVVLRGDSLDVTGYSSNDVERLIEKYAERQQANETAWRKEIEGD